MSPTPKTLWIREPYLAQVLAGRKTIEVRVGYGSILRLQPGDLLRLNGTFLAEVRRVNRYEGFEGLLANEPPAAIAPELPPGELLDALRQIYPHEKEDLGVVALELAVRRYDAILFDLGYTLVFFEPPQEIIVQEALLAAGDERSVDEIKAAADVVWGNYHRDAATVTFPATEQYDRDTQLALIRDLLTELGLAGDKRHRQAYTESLESRYSKPGTIRPYTEVGEVLTTLRQEGYSLGIVSNWSWNLRDRVSQVGLEHFFELVWASAYAGCNKPHPKIFAQALDRMQPAGLAPERVLYVGDSYQHDVVGARNAGLDVVLLDRDGTADDPGCPVVGNLYGLIGLLDAADGSQDMH
ncbi:HAD-IIIA family hydrolase [Chloroflexota bacterium]